MIATRRALGVVGLSLALAFGAAGCGASAADSIASDTCDLLKDTDVQKIAGDVDAQQEFVKKIEALEKRAKKEDLSDKEIEAAVKKECADEVKEWEKLGG